MRWLPAALLLFSVSPARAGDEDPPCRGGCSTQYQACTRTCRPAPGEPFDSRKIDQCGDRCLKQARDCNRRCAGR